MSVMGKTNVRHLARRGGLQGLSVRLLALALLGGMAGAAAPVAAQAVQVGQPFDRQAQTQRYLRWVDDFQRDLRKLSGVRNPSEADIERLFADTLVPGSRAVEFVRQMAAQPEGSVSGGIAFQGPARLMINVLRDSVVAGDGGVFTDHPEGKQAKTFRVWYLHIDGGGLLEPYFNDADVFKPYHLPPDGTLQRHVYPFLLFEDGPTLRLGAFTQEFVGVIRFLDNKQHA